MSNIFHQIAYVDHKPLEHGILQPPAQRNIPAYKVLQAVYPGADEHLRASPSTYVHRVRLA